MKNLILTLIITLPITLWGQGWEQTYGGANGDDYGRSVQQTNDGGYIIVGYTNSFGNSDTDIYLIKTDGNGDSLWTKTFGGTDKDKGYSVQQTTDGGYIIVGSSRSFGNGSADVYLIKTDVNGDSLWTKTFGGEGYEIGKSVQQTTDGGYIITGKSSSFGNGDNDIYLIKTDSQGDSIWTKTFVANGADEANSVQQTNDGGYIITGYIEYNEEDGEVWLLKTDGNGIQQWSQVFGGGGFDFSFSVKETTDDGYIIAGSNEEGDNHQSYLIKTDNNGDSIWTKTFGGIDDESTATSVELTSDGGYIIAGHLELDTDFSQHIYLFKIDNNGDSLWTKTFAPYFGNIGWQVEQTLDGGYIIVGYTDESGNGNYQVLLIKTDDQGNINSTFEIPLPNPNRKLEKTINLKGQEIKPQTNTPIIEIFDDGSVEKKIIVE